MALSRWVVVGATWFAPSNEESERVGKGRVDTTASRSLQAVIRVVFFDWFRWASWLSSHCGHGSTVVLFEGTPTVRGVWVVGEE